MSVFDNLPSKASLEKRLAEIEEERKQLKTLLKVVEDSEKFQTKPTISRSPVSSTRTAEISD